MYPLAILSHLRPPFAYILDHYGRARSRRRARRGEAPLRDSVMMPYVDVDDIDR